MSGIALAMLIDNSSTAISTYGLTALQKGDEHPAYACSFGIWQTLSFTSSDVIQFLQEWVSIEINFAGMGVARDTDVPLR